MARELSSSPQDTEDRSPSDPHKNTSDAIKRNSMDNGNDRESKSISASPFSSPQAAKQNCQSRSPSMASAGEGIDSRMKRFDGIDLPERKDSENNISPKKNGIAVRVGNLTRNVNKEHLTEIFAKFGNVTRVKLMTERGTKLSKGSALIDFETEEDAEKAIEHMHDGWLDGKKVTVLLVTDDPVGEEEKACDKSSVENGHTGKNDARDSRKRSSSVRNGRDSHGSPRRISRPSSTRPDSNFAKNRRGFPGRKHGGYAARSRSITRRGRSRSFSKSKSSVSRRRFASPFRPRRQKDDHKSRRRSPFSGRGRGRRFQSRGRSSVSSSRSVSSRSKSYSRSRSRREARRPGRRGQSRRSPSLSKSFSSSNSSVSRSFSRSPSRSRSSARVRRRRGASPSSSLSRSS